MAMASGFSSGLFCCCPGKFVALKDAEMQLALRHFVREFPPILLAVDLVVQAVFLLDVLMQRFEARLLFRTGGAARQIAGRADARMSSLPSAARRHCRDCHNRGRGQREEGKLKTGTARMIVAAKS